MLVSRHWIDELADSLEEKLRSRGKEVLVFNGGLSVSGLQHVGRLRGEIIIPETLRRILRDRGLRIKQYLTLYTQDAWKGKESQRRAFKDPGEAKKYAGWPLIRVPDPYGCHRNWVEHFWNDFGPYIKEFTDGEIEVVTTTDLYAGKLKEFTKKTFEIRDRVREIINKYRGRKKYPESWIPFEPVCEKCGRIDKTEATKITGGEKVEYRCKNCGHHGVTSIDNGKLNWRIEWVGVWWALGVDFEPYGKDHATPGGSRDSCVDLAVNAYGVKPPEGIPYEWVAMRTRDKRIVDMSSSDFTGFTPREWFEVAHPHIYRFLVLRTPPMKKLVVSLYEIPQYYSQYYQAERIYYGVEDPGDEEKKILLSRSYELSYPHGSPPPEMPEQVPYTHLAVLVQLVPKELWATEGLKRLRNSGHLPENPTDYGVKRILETMEKASNWVKKYAPDYLKIKLLPEPDPKIIEEIPPNHREILYKMGEMLEELKEWSDEAIKNIMIEATKELSPKERRELYHNFYKLFLGQPSGPRAAPLIALIGRETSVRFLKSVKK
ncbi:MAG: lysine--tRNA ligase [Crenarchaeota archaeon]|nr:lysine--tRNA ligase [Thermoproteota archaeon]